MATDYFLNALDRYRITRADFVGCDVDDFDREDLVIVEKRPHPGAKHLAIALTFGTGTVVSVAADYLEWTRANAPRDKHYRAMFPNALLQPLKEEGARRGESIDWRSPNLSFLPTAAPSAIRLPPEFTGLEFGRDWRDQIFPTGEFHNALGELDDPDNANFRYGFAILHDGRPAAVAGGWDDFGNDITEIGVDVARGFRGMGLAPVVVTNLAAMIAARGEIPAYYCAPTNIRSHRNAIACGFTPVASAARAVRQLPS